MLKVSSISNNDILSTLSPGRPIDATSLVPASSLAKNPSTLSSEPLRTVDDQQAARKALDLLVLDAPRVISSPYPDLENQLDLRPLDTPNRLLALAFTALQPIRSDYATADYLSSFNWDVVFSILQLLCLQAGFEWGTREFYLVIFRSKLRSDADRDRLGVLDQKSHEEACASGGLLKYWFGSTDGERNNLATCIWRNREDAAAGGKGPWHAKARASARTMYENISFHTHRFIIDEGGRKWKMEDYKS
ncbi:Hypothetical protein R9X50_00361500 [Acrodontium crateriforme]|uniref:Uncharacterized protein n=1 Tax=Acrodontium crateriforme TaxID=150365 RepID=A0AAQ3M4L7_9PEZI|nr:Hypothetical protein R9X50_00361500 [Acrodontium crateriforme]